MALMNGFFRDVVTLSMSHSRLPLYDVIRPLEAILVQHRRPSQSCWQGSACKWHLGHVGLHHLELASMPRVPPKYKRKRNRGRNGGLHVHEDPSAGDSEQPKGPDEAWRSWSKSDDRKQYDIQHGRECGTTRENTWRSWSWERHSLRASTGPTSHGPISKISKQT